MTDPNTDPPHKPGELAAFLAFNLTVLDLSCVGAARD
jgi:hypothetical protein